MDKILIHNLRAHGIIGIFPHERQIPQDILINITVYTDTSRAAQTDDIADCVDYDALAKKVKSHAETIARLTVEALANDIAQLCLAERGVEESIAVLASMGSYQAVESYREILETKLSFHDPALEQRYWAQQQGEYCSNCGACSGVCPQGPAVQRVLRYRMYYRDYGMKDYARSKYQALGLGPDPAAVLDCASCESVCPRGLPLREMG